MECGRTRAIHTPTPPSPNLVPTHPANPYLSIPSKRQRLGNDAEPGGPTPSLLDAIRYHDVDGVRQLAEKANLETPDIDGRTPAYIAAQEGAAEVLRVLAELGANLETQDTDGFTPACVAAENGHAEVLRVLDDLGANLETPNTEGFTPAHMAAENGHAEVLRVLDELGANLETQDTDGFAPAHIAAQEGHAEVLRVLDELGANLETQDTDGIAPVHIAAGNGHADVMLVLAELGVALELRDLYGRTAAYIAALAGHEAVWRMMAGFEANLDAPRNEGMNAPKRRGVGDGGRGSRPEQQASTPNAGEQGGGHVGSDDDVAEDGMGILAHRAQGVPVR